MVCICLPQVSRLFKNLTVLRRNLHSEARCPHPSLVGELQEQPVSAYAGEHGMERKVCPDAAGGMDVQESEVAFAQGHQVAQSAEIGFELLDLPTAGGDAKGEGAFGTGSRGPCFEGDLVVLDVDYAGRIGER